MLVLSRKDGEQILVGDNVIIKVLAVAHGRVRVGIEAPREISVRRSEITRQPREFNIDLSDSIGSNRLVELAGTVH